MSSGRVIPRKPAIPLRSDPLTQMYPLDPVQQRPGQRLQADGSKVKGHPFRRISPTPAPIHGTGSHLPREAETEDSLLPEVVG